MTCAPLGASNRATSAEVAAVRSGVGINEVQNFGKFEIRGPKARAWLDKIMAGRIPKQGRLSLTPMLSPKGKLLGDFTVSCLADDWFQLTASYGYQTIHQRWFEKHRIDGVQVRNVSDQLTGFQIAGPRARDVLTAALGRDPGMAFLDVRATHLDSVECIIQRVSYTGDLGYEIYCGPMDQRRLWNILWAAGEPYDITPFGMRAMMSLRLDRFFGSWLSEFSPDYTAAETGMDRFISFKKNVDFIGRAAAEAERATPPARTLASFIVDANDADVTAYEPVFINGEVKGFCTSGGYSHHAQKSVALALILREVANEGLEVEIEILGELRKATLVTTPLFDPEGEAFRA